MDTLYCGRECQVADWHANHKTECIGVNWLTYLFGGGEKRDRDEDQDESDESKRARKLRQLVFENKDLLSIIIPFVHGKDLKNVSLATKKMSIVARKHMLKKYVWVLGAHSRYDERISKRNVEHMRTLSNIQPPRVNVMSIHVWNYMYENYREWFDKLTELVLEIEIPLNDTMYNLILPPRLKVLRVYGRLLHNVRFNFPETLEVLKFESPCSVQYSSLPGGLKVYHLSEITISTNYLPPNLEEISYGRMFQGPLMLEMTPHIQRLIIWPTLHGPMNFPDTVTELTLFGDWLGTIDLPRNLKKLDWRSYDFNRSFVLPEGIKYIRFLGPFNQPINLPDSVEYFHVNLNSFKQMVRLPEGIIDTNLPKELQM